MGVSKKLWSGAVTKGSNALDLERGVFTWVDNFSSGKNFCVTLVENVGYE